MLIELRLFLTEFFLYLAMRVVPKQTLEAKELAKCLRDYLNKSVKDEIPRV